MLHVPMLTDTSLQLHSKVIAEADRPIAQPGATVHFSGFPPRQNWTMYTPQVGFRPEIPGGGPWSGSGGAKKIAVMSPGRYWHWLLWMSWWLIQIRDAENSVGEQQGWEMLLLWAQMTRHSLYAHAFVACNIRSLFHYDYCSVVFLSSVTVVLIHLYMQ
jgi:hypothetical protein